MYTLEGPKNVDGGNIFKFQGIIEFPERFLIKGGKKEEKYLSNIMLQFFLPDVPCHGDAVPTNHIF